MKTCTKCKEIKDLSGFNRNKTTKSGYHGWCKKCSDDAKKEDHRLDPTRRKSWQLKQYGISLEQYNQLLREQNNVCFTCKQSPSGRYKALCVDHDHETGKVRGLLCHNCNRALGLLKDDFEIVLKLAQYVCEHKDIL